jgi:RecB family endonuclease NucS
LPIYEFAQSGIVSLTPTTFGAINLQKRRDLQRLLRENVEVISPDTLVISEEFGEWEDSKRRIDLLGLDRDANLVVIELKRTEDGGHMELQAIRYASMVSTMTFDRAIEVLRNF